MTSWSLARNLQVRKAAVQAEWPGTVVFDVGDLAHQAECSDHNPDARGIVHAIDVMTYGDEVKATAVVNWAVGAPDVQYVIHNRVIRSRTTGWKATPYTGSNPHTDHVHISGRHGTAGANAATCTGYDTAAEAMTPEGIDMQLSDKLPGTDTTVGGALATVYTRSANLGPWLKEELDGVVATLANMPSAVEDALTIVPPGGQPFTSDQIAQVRAAMVSVLSSVKIEVPAAS